MNEFIVGWSIGISILISILLGITLGYMSNIDEKRMESAERYFNCVTENYHMTPEKYYYQYNEYPLCQKK